jgi:hypothetical protein
MWTRWRLTRNLPAIRRGRGFEQRPAGVILDYPILLDWAGPVARRTFGRHVPLFYFRICNGNYSGTSGEGFDLADKDAAWAEMTRVCGDLVGGIARRLQQQTEWRMELLDESRKPVFRIRLLAETLDLKASPDE